MFGDFVEYDETSRTCLRRKIAWIVGRGGLREPVGSVAGTLHHTGYWRVYIRGKSYAAHRIIWELHNGEIPKGVVIDHINGIRSDNRISNLRLVEQRINSRNASMYSVNSSGVTGVSYMELTSKRNDVYRYWRANWKDLTGKQWGKSFRIDKFGYEEAFNMATEYRVNRLAELNTTGAGYTNRHGQN